MEEETTRHSAGVWGPPEAESVRNKGATDHVRGAVNKERETSVTFCSWGVSPQQLDQTSGCG